MARNCYLVTGAAGRLGRKFVEVLSENNIDDVTKLKLFDLKFTDDVKTKQLKLCRESSIEIEWIEGNITDEDSVDSALEDVDVVIHMASIIDIRDEIPWKTLWNVNVNGTRYMINGCCRRNIRYFVYTSSSEAVGPNRHRDPLDEGDEETPYHFDTPLQYGMTKHEADKMTLAENGRKLESGKKFVTCALRPGGIYGGVEDYILMNSLRLHHKSKVIPSVSSPHHLQDRVHIDNVAWAHILAAKSIQEKPGLIGGNAYFLGDDTPRMSYARLNLQFTKPYGYKISREPLMPFWAVYTLMTIMHYIARFLLWFGSKRQLPISPHCISAPCTHFTYSHKKFKKHFAYKPYRSWEESLEQTRKDVGKMLEEIERTND